MNSTVITPKSCGDLLYGFVQQHSNSAAIKEISHACGYKYSFFTPLKKLHLFEELILLNISLAIHEANVALEDSLILEDVIDNFLNKAKSNVLTSLETDNDEFKDKYSARLEQYFDSLTESDALGLSGDFLVNLFKSPDARWKTGPQLKLALIIGQAKSTLQNFFQKIKIEHEHNY